MQNTSVNTLCDQAQEYLSAMDYWTSEKLLEQAEQLAGGAKDWDALSRLYMPLQEVRRQRRQRCGEGIVKLDLLARDETDPLDAQPILNRYSHGQLIVAGWASVQPAVELRRLAREQQLYVETFLAAVFPIVGGGRAIVICPTADVALPDASPRPVDALLASLPPHSICLGEKNLPQGEQKGDAQTYGRLMALWEELHSPFLAAARMQVHPLQKMQSYRKTIDVDYACEFAHQEFSTTAREMLRAGAAR